MRTDAFAPWEPGPAALFLETSALFSLYYDDASRHTEVRAVFDALAGGALPYRTLMTNRYVVDELLTLLQSRANNEYAVEALNGLAGSGRLSVLAVDDPAFEAAADRFRTYSDHAISFTDHTIGVQARRRDVDHVFSYDGDFETLGLTTVPRWSA